ncbi:LytR C-terminal domain-containing protein [Streptacidiphilus fuscans]|uniref:LytR C-terminal domain-containing protein n=1 Tax=Streptacidiphilus fuscans TaxID=2789292 RepID=A0A931BFR4_9ACTN|nr:LytR C-terminal domain-containing protein [Streptacidiphilus fuscans]MBF9073313.1 LytR C-terminal domain-containing protein [Streptacidiphilus fuscans]
MGTRGKGRRADSSRARTRSRRASGGRAGSRRGAHGGPWLAAAAGFLALMVIGGFLLLHGAGKPNAAAAIDASGTAAATRASSPTAAPSPTCTPEPADAAFAHTGSKAQPINVRVTVLNGSGTFGQAEAVLSWMQNTAKFLRTSNGGPAPHNQPLTSLVYAPNHVDQARTLVAALGLPVASLHGNGTSTGLRDPMVLTLGADFHGVGKEFTAC